MWFRSRKTEMPSRPQRFNEILEGQIKGAEELFSDAHPSEQIIALLRTGSLPEYVEKLRVAIAAQDEMLAIIEAAMPHDTVLVNLSAFRAHHAYFVEILGQMKSLCAVV